MRKIILLCALMATPLFAAPLFAQMVAPTLELPAANDTSVSASPLLQTAHHGMAIIQFEVDSVNTFNSPAKQSAVSAVNKWGEKEEGRVTFLQYNTKYYLRARSTMDGDTSPWTSVTSFRTTRKPILDGPKNNSSLGASAFYWYDAGSLTYTLQLDTTEDFSSPFAQNIYVKDTAFSKYNSIYTYAEKLLYGKKHYWRVQAYHKNDTSEWSDTWSFNMPGGTSLKSPATNTANLGDVVELEWNRIWDAHFYQIEYDTMADFSSAIKKDTLTKNWSNSKITINNLYFGSKYYWRVRAIYADDSSNWTDVWSFTTIDKVTLKSPFNTKTYAYLTESLNWTDIAISLPNTYLVQVDSAMDFSSPHLQQEITTTEWARLKDRMFGTEYFWRVRAVNKNDTSAWSNVWKLTTTDRSTPIIIFPENKKQNLALKVEFTTVNEIEGHKTVFELDTSINFNSAILIRDTLKHLPTDKYPKKTVNNLYFGATYYWRTKVYNRADSTHWAKPYSFTTIAKPTLEFPYNNQPNFGTETNILVKKMAGADYYIWELDTNANFNSPALRTDTSSYTTVDPGGEFYFDKWYYWRFKAVNQYDSSEWSETWKFQSTNHIFLFEPKNNTYNVSNKPKIDFGGVGGATGYQLLMSKDSTFKDVKPVTVFGQANTEFNVTASYGSTYYWKVRAFHAKDTSPWSARWVFHTKNAPVIPAPILTSPKNNAVVAPGRVSFTWNSNGIDAFSYDFQLSYTNDFASPIIDSEVPYTFAAINNIQQNTEYFWRVRTYYDTLVSAWSSTYKFSTQNVSIDENSLDKNSVNVYPNPATQKLYIVMPENALMQGFVLMDVSGKTLLQENIAIAQSKQEIDVSVLKPGLYILQIRTNNGMVHKQIIKQ